MPPEPVELCAEWRVPSVQATVVGVAAQSVLRASRRERGCVSCSLTTELAERATLRLHEVWDSEPSLRRYVQSGVFESLVGLLETAVEPPLLEITVNGRTRGFDYVGEVRNDG